MGTCCGGQDELNEVLKSVKERAPEIGNECILTQKAIDATKEKLLKERKEAIENAIANNSNNEDIKGILKTYNLKELEIEKDYFMNEVNKMHNLYELGLDLSKPAKDATVKQIKKAKCSKCCFSATVISHVEKYSPKEFFNSKFGKPLKTAIEKEGMSEAILIDKKNELLEDRKKRREEEKTMYNLEQNEFPPDDDLNIDTEKIYEDIFEDYLNQNKEYENFTLG